MALLHVNVVSHITQAEFVRGCWLFVDFFFVLSGFVIAFVYLDRIDGGGAFIEFAIRRFGRLWPLHACMLLLFFLSETTKVIGAAAGLPVHVAAFAGSYAPRTFAANLLMLHGFGIDQSPNWPSWSIAVEFYAYFVFAALCVAARRRLPIAAAAVIAGAVAALWLWSPQYLAASLNWGIFRCLYGFFVGVLTLLAFRACRKLPAAFLCEAGSVGLVIAFILACRRHNAVTMLAPPVFAAAVFSFAFEAGPLSRLLARRCFTWLGERSYGVYMVHAFAVFMVTRILALAGGYTGAPLLTHMRFDGQMTDMVAPANPFVADALVLLYLTVVVAAAHVAYGAVERPGRAFFNRLAVAHAARRPAAAAAGFRRVAAAVRGRPR